MAKKTKVTSSRKTAKSKHSEAKQEPLADRIRDYADRYRNWFDIEGTRVGPIGTEESKWQVIRRATPLQISNAGAYIHRLLRLGCFKNDAPDLRRHFKEGGGKALWADFVSNLRARANLPYTFDHEKSFEDDRRLAADAIEAEALIAERKEWKVIEKEPFDDDTPVPPRRIAERCKLPYGRVCKRLERLRGNNEDCFVEVQNRRKNEPKYLYYWGKVKEVIQAMKPLDKMSDGRPTEKKLH